MEITQIDLQEIVQAVVANLTAETVAATPPPLKETRRGASIYQKAAQGDAPVASAPVSTEICTQAGVFTDVKQALEAAHQAQLQYIAGCKLEDRARIIEAIRKRMLAHKETMARMAVEETKLGRYEDKLAKITLAATSTPGTEILETKAVSGDAGLTIEEMAPFGLIGAVSPVTNPMETIINNAIGILAGGNAVVFNVHPSSKQTCAWTVEQINHAITEAGGPANLVSMVKEPSIESLEAIIQDQNVRLLLGTGGPGLVKKLLSSGKKAIGAAAGNPPVIVDETADIALAAGEIIKGASFDNNLLCIAEKEVFVLDAVADDLIFSMLKQGAALLTQQQVEQVMQFALHQDEKGVWHTAKDWVGKNAADFLQKLGIAGQDDVRLLIFEAELTHPFVQLEQMMPVLPIVRAANLEQAIKMAVSAEHGNRHTASMFSRNVENLTAFARAVNTTIFVKNAATLAGVGYGGEGYTTFTIAGATGEGLTCAKTFTRTRRCVLGEGGFRII